MNKHQFKYIIVLLTCFCIFTCPLLVRATTSAVKYTISTVFGTPYLPHVLNTFLDVNQMPLNGAFATVEDATSGNMYISDTNNHVVRVIQKIDSTSHVHVGTGIASNNGMGRLGNITALNSPTALMVNSNGDVFLCDTGRLLFLLNTKKMRNPALLMIRKQSGD